MPLQHTKTRSVRRHIRAGVVARSHSIAIVVAARALGEVIVDELGNDLIVVWVVIPHSIVHNLQHTTSALGTIVQGQVATGQRCRTLRE